MTWPVAIALTVALAVAFGAGVVLGRVRATARLSRLSDGLAELTRGNLAHRVILPGDDRPARIAGSLNALADSVQREREASAGRDAAQRRLLANISHDLRTPITSIAGYADALQRGLGDEPERYLAVISAKADDLARLTDDLFYAARIDSGDLDLARDPVDLAEAVRRSVLGYESQLAEAGARVDLSIPDEPCIVEADGSAVARILSNLVSNSLRHGRGMTAFALTMHTLNGRYVVRVSNDGPPLPDDPERLLRRGVAGPQGGTGLGLAIARELAERMGGSVAAESSTPEGASFTLTMPRCDFKES